MLTCCHLIWRQFLGEVGIVLVLAAGILDRFGKSRLVLLRVFLRHLLGHLVGPDGRRLARWLGHGQSSLRHFAALYALSAGPGLIQIGTATGDWVQEGRCR